MLRSKHTNGPYGLAQPFFSGIIVDHITHETGFPHGKKSHPAVKIRLLDPDFRRYERVLGQADHHAYADRYTVILFKTTAERDQHPVNSEVSIELVSQSRWERFRGDRPLKWKWVEIGKP